MYILKINGFSSLLAGLSERKFRKLKMAVGQAGGCQKGIHFVLVTPTTGFRMINGKYLLKRSFVYKSEMCILLKILVLIIYAKNNSS